ncbi:META domain-containing protein [Hymenobacter ruricola]|uniref:META domain-containing protein n=1 Tax=Hymenobacter ruricola TaxID=2791023 RepID=A0ABS0I5U2_9BACT|nr:META domain-containing protein [Hymenobacter ruricola]MBF9221942.1 META domain-containing protein [Hymenobacter ruricola]
MTPSRRLLPLALLATLALSSCEKEELGSPTAATLLDARWMLAQVDDFPVAAASYSGTAGSYLEFVGLGTCTVGLGPCNNFSGRFTLGGGQQLALSAPIPTRVPCPVQDLENHYLTNLALTARYEISGEELRLFDKEKAAPRLVFHRAGK